MKRSTFILALAWFLAAALQGQEFQEGTWSGTSVRVGGRNNNPQAQRVSLEVKKIPDPHWRWRPGKGEVLNVTFIMPQGRAQVSDLRVEKGSLSFWYRQEVLVTCRLDRQADDVYQGECVGDGDARRFRVTLTPPKASG